MRDLVRGLRLPRVVLAYPGDAGIEVAEVIDGDLGAPLRYSLPLATPVPRFAAPHPEAEKAFEQHPRIVPDRRRSTLHHLLYWPLSIAGVLSAAASRIVMTLHDFYAICPNANLLDLTTLKRCCPRSADPMPSHAVPRCAVSQLAVDPPPDAGAVSERTSSAFADAARRRGNA